MPPLETMDRNQHAVLWQRTFVNSRPASTKHGKPLVGSPSDIMVQWDDSYTEGRDAKGNKVQADGTIFYNQAITIGSVVWFGTVAQMTAQQLEADTAIQLFEVVFVNITPDLKGRNFCYEYGIKRFTDHIPLS